MEDAGTEHELVVAPAVDASVRRRRRVRRAVLSGLIAAPVVAVLAVPTLHALASGDDTADEVSAAADDDEPTTSTTRRTSTTTSTTAEAIVAETTTTAQATTVAPTTTGPTTTAPRRTTTTTAPAPTPTTLPAHCRNSTDPACGPFYWDPAPAPNQPLTASFVDVPARWNRWDGGLVLEFDYADPDAPMMTISVWVDGVLVDGAGTSLADCYPLYGPWTPFGPLGRSGRAHPNPVYLSDGPHEIRVRVGSGGCREIMAYASETELITTVEVVYEPPPPEEPPPTE